MGARRKARKRALDVLFEADQRDVHPLDMLEERQYDSGMEHPLPPYTVELVTGVGDYIDLIDETIETYSIGWSIERMPAVDKALARIACYEIAAENIPPAVAVNEAIELARELSTDKSPEFLNGLLGQILAAPPVLDH